MWLIRSIQRHMKGHFLHFTKLATIKKFDKSKIVRLEITFE